MDTVLPGVLPLPLALRAPFFFPEFVSGLVPFLTGFKRRRENIERTVTALLGSFERWAPVSWNNFFYSLDPGAKLIECGLVPYWAGGCYATARTAGDVNARLAEVKAAYAGRGAQCQVFSHGPSWLSSAYWVKWGCTFRTSDGVFETPSTSSTFFFYIREREDLSARIRALLTPDLDVVAQLA